MLFRRDALEAFCRIDDPPHVYVETFVPTTIYHLGFDVADVDAFGDLYAAVRWRPEFTLDDARAPGNVRAASSSTPLKALDGLSELLRAPGPTAQTT